MPMRFANLERSHTNAFCEAAGANHDGTVCFSTHPKTGFRFLDPCCRHACAIAPRLSRTLKFYTFLLPAVLHKRLNLE